MFFSDVSPCRSCPLASLPQGVLESILNNLEWRDKVRSFLHVGSFVFDWKEPL